jgi:hypothetical protein
MIWLTTKFQQGYIDMNPKDQSGQWTVVEADIITGPSRRSHYSR